MEPETVPDSEPEPSMLDPRVMDPDEEIVRRAGMDEQDVDQVVRVLEALRGWRETERRMSEASRRYMKLGDTDMRALRYIIAMQNHGRIVTPGAIAEHLRITTASTTKLIDRLTAGGHVVRFPHPSDRRSLAIEVTDETRRAARESVGRSHARRFDAAARLTPKEREIVARFLDDLANTDREPGDGDGVGRTGTHQGAGHGTDGVRGRVIEVGPEELLDQD
ncbi:MarR family winged helix-turn-helix transcriptional regulator [Promicromonospora kroppenstedtii]|uniref:MarR family winged helix-turn-helix transcriptional regulator n=1 Tax=Promicromonospora kroppenstedtii TaxID=440482 RepID=A0ABW7XNM8_9MICO